MAVLNLNSWSIGKASNLTVEGSSSRVKFSNGASFNDSMTWSKACIAVSNIQLYRSFTLNTTQITGGSGIWSCYFGIFSNYSYSKYSSSAANNGASGVLAWTKLSTSSGSRTYTVNVPSGASGTAYVGFCFYDNSTNSSMCDNACRIFFGSIVGTEGNYTVVLNTSAGISSISPAASNSVAPGGSLSIDATVSSGYAWNRWTGNTSYLTSAATVKANTVQANTNNISLTATATGNTYYVQYNKNGSYVGKTDEDVKGTMSNSTCVYGTAKNLTAIAYSLTGYSFNGWNTKSDGTGTNYADKASVSTLTTTSGATVHLYAKWKANTYTIEYNANGGSGTMPNATHTYDSTKSLTKNTFTKENYMFMGWSTSSNGDVEYTDEESVKNLATSGTITLYAVWMHKGTIRIMVSGEYKMAQVYVYSGGWKLTQPQCYSNGWKLCGG